MSSFTVFAQRLEDDNHIVVDKSVRICINCGYNKLDKTEFCLSCENCGTTMFFE